MSLSLFWKNNKADFEAKHIKQLVALAGSGELKDGAKTSSELRELFTAVPLDSLGRYLNECLDGGFPDSGLVLQDIVNQLGERLGCSVTYGRYRGTTKEIGFDGVWRFPNGYAIVIEVKTTDTYTINLDTVARYRKALVGQGQISSEESSILVVVGRHDTGSLEAQVRGSRHGWDVRLISADKLLRLVEIKHETDSNATIEKIQTVLRPLELTRVDFIVDLLASTTSDIRDSPESEIVDTDAAITSHGSDERRFSPAAFHDEVANAVAKHLGLELQRATKTTYISLDKQTSVRCVVSKAHESGAGQTYWTAFHSHYKDAADEFPNAYLAIGCGSPKKILLFRLEEFIPLLDRLNRTENEDRVYWHIQVYDDGRRFSLNVKGGGPGIDVTSHALAE